MSETQKNSPLSNHLYIVYTLSAILVIVIWYYQWELGLFMALALIASFFYSLRKEMELTKKTEQYISTLSHRIKKVSKEALLEMPIGIILYNEEYNIEWSNPYINQLCKEESLVGHSLELLSENLIPMIKEENEEISFSFQGYKLHVLIKGTDRLLYLFDKTNQDQIETLYEEKKPIISIIYLDNYDEITKNMEDALKSKLNSNVTSVLNKWAHDCGLYLKRTSQDRFIAVGMDRTLKQLESSKFEILDDVREIDAEMEQKNPITLSIGIGAGDVSLPTLGELAQSSLDLALGRGGDQVVIKDENGKVKFYGGKTNPMEKRTRVRARVISHALKELVQASDNVIIMGHKSPDMDSLGAAIGVLNIAKSNGIDGFIIFDEEDIHTGVYRMVEAIKEEPEVWQHFIDPNAGEDIITSRSLIVVVDTHKPALVANERLLDKTEYKVVIDHHRRGEDFIEEPTLVYMEPYASSTAELVTELLEYQPNNLKLKMLEATALLAGIIVDTKSFTLRTGSRTFDAASYLRSKGADTVLVQRFMKEDLDVYVRRSKLVERANVCFDSIAISKAEHGDVFDQVLLAQTADTLLTMSGINASFVIAPISQDKIGVSARSLGEINVQVVMEKMDGGGHLTNAATQLEDVTTEDVYQLLYGILEEYFEGRT